MSTEVMERPALEPQKVEEDYRAHKLRDREGRGGVASANWVTTLAHACEAYAVYNRRVPYEQRRKIDAGLAMIFSEGNDQARAIKRDLLDMGYEVEGEEGQMAWPAFQITGRKDFKLRRQGLPSVRVEAKSCNPYIFDSLKTVQDLRNHRSEWVQKWDKQVAVYMVLQNVDHYWLLLKNKSTGNIHIIEYHLGDEELQIAEAMLKKAERVNKLVQIGQAPSADQKISNPDDCARCEFFPVCLPELNFGLAAKVLTDELAAEMQAKLDRHATLKPFSKEYEELDEELKGEVKSLTVDGTEDVVIGDWLAHVKLINVKAVPAKTVEAKAASTRKQISFTKVEQVSVSG